MFNLTYEFKLKLTKQQQAIFEDWLKINRQVYNYALAERKDWYKSRSCPVNACSLHSEYIISANTPRPTYASQCKALTEAKQQYPELKQVRAQGMQQTLKRLEKAFTSMWERNFGFPRFKKPGRMRSFVFPQLSKKPLKGQVKLPSIGWVKFRQSREIPSLAVKRGVYFLKVDSKKTCQICPNCLTQTGKKELSERVRECSNCGYTTDTRCGSRSSHPDKRMCSCWTNGQDAVFWASSLESR